MGGSGNTPVKPSKPNTAIERLVNFKKTCNALQQLWRTSTPLTDDESAASYAKTYLERLNTLISDESRAPAPHPCLQYAASSQFYIIVAKLALSALDAEITNEAALFFNTLIDGEVDGVLDSRIFARALIDLVKRHAGTRGTAGGQQTEGKLIELLFGVANKIRVDPELLFAWFYPERSNGHSKEASDESAAFAGATRTDDFPLFYMLIEFVHDDGRTGDFARTGLLYIIETASRAKHLERWLIESDLATLMASGLGALYSRLSRRLPALSETHNLPAILALSDDSQAPPSAEATTTSEFQGLLDAFLSYLLFWQDTLEHCWSVEVKDTLLDHFQILFLQQLLYPSLLESSDIDGGSTASVITYLYRILDSLDHPELVQRILQYLLAFSKHKVGMQDQSQKPVHMSLSRRKSLNVLAALAEAEQNPSPDLFNLVDLITMCVRSKSSQTVAASLKLVSIMLRRHHDHAMSALFKSRTDGGLLRRPIGALNAEMEELFCLASSIPGEKAVDQAYDSILKDTLMLLETHSCQASCDTAFSMAQDTIADRALGEIEQTLISKDDTLLKELLQLLTSFFTNSVMTNLALTEALIGLACCQKIALDGWLLVELCDYRYDTTLTLGQTHSHDRAAYDHPSWDETNCPPLRTTLEALVGQVEQWQDDLPDFKASLAAHRAFLAEGDASGNSSSVSQDVSEHVAAPQSRSLSVDIINKRNPKAWSRSISPRGRKAQLLDGSTPTSVSASPSPAPKKALTKTQFGSVPSTLSQQSSRSGSLAPDLLRKRIAMPFRGPMMSLNYDSASDSGSLPGAPSTDASSGFNTPRDQEQPQTMEVSLAHILTNTIILQEFILELAAVVQTRASLFDEVRFD